MTSRASIPLDGRAGHESTVARILASHGITGHQLQFTSGSRNSVARVGRTCVVRLSSAADAPGRFAAEASLLRQVRTLVPVPEVIGVGDLDGVGYQIQACVEGTSLADSWQTLPRHQQGEVADQLAGIMRALHTVTFPDFGPLCPPAASWPSWQARIVCRIAAVVSELQQLDTPVPARFLDVVSRFVAERSGCLDRVGQAVLVHNDLWPGNVMVAGGRITAILDFELAQRAPHDAELFKLDSFCAEPELYAHRGDYRELFARVVHGYPELLDPNGQTSSRLDLYDTLTVWNTYLFDAQTGRGGPASATAAIDRSERIMQGRITRMSGGTGTIGDGRSSSTSRI